LGYSHRNLRIVGKGSDEITDFELLSETVHDKMTSELNRVLSIFTNLLVKGNDFTPAGVEAARKEACAKFEVHKHKRPDVSTASDDSFVESTLREAIEKHRKPLRIPYFVNQYGNMESTIVKGLIFEDRDGQITAIGVQDEDRIAPLGINQLRCCYYNGYFFDKNNTVNSATTMSGPLSK